MNRIFLRCAAAAIVLGYLFFFALALDADATEPQPVAVSADPAVIAEGERLAVAYARAEGWPDHCPRGVAVIFIANVDEIVGSDANGFTLDDGCKMYLEPSLAQPTAKAQLCDTYVHERLHKARGDGWHSAVVGDPLYSIGPESLPSMYAPCRAAFAPQTPAFQAEMARQHDARWAERALTRDQARVAVRRKLGRRWKIRTAIASSQMLDGTEYVEQFDVTARRKKCRTSKGKRRCQTLRRNYEVTRQDGRLRVVRATW